jgi:hypothetical protein
LIGKSGLYDRFYPAAHILFSSPLNAGKLIIQSVGKFTDASVFHGVLFSELRDRADSRHNGRRAGAPDLLHRSGLKPRSELVYTDETLFHFITHSFAIWIMDFLVMPGRRCLKLRVNILPFI